MKSLLSSFNSLALMLHDYSIFVQTQGINRIVVIANCQIYVLKCEGVYRLPNFPCSYRALALSAP